MKFWVLVLLAVALGVGVLIVSLATCSDPRGRTERAPLTPAATPAPKPAKPPANLIDPTAEPRPAAARPDDTGRQSVAAAPTPATRAVLEGAVIGDGAPLPGAELELAQGEELLGEARTDERGRFRLESRPLTGQGTLRIRARGFVTIERALPARPAGGTLALGNVRLLRGQLLTGRVLDQIGRPIPDADIAVEPLTPTGDVLIARARTGPEGTFDAPEAPPGPVRVTARARGFGEVVVQHTRGANAGVDIRMEPGIDLRMRIVTTRGAPVVGAEVTIQAPSDPRPGTRTLKSDAEGRVVFEGLGARPWNVRVTHPEYRPAGKSQVQATGTEETIQCTPWPAILGTVRAPGNAPPPAGARVHALPASAPGERAGVTTVPSSGGAEVAADGSFRLTGLRPGDWRVLVTAPGFATTSSQPVKLGIEGDGFTGTIVLVQGGSLEFALTLGGKPVVGAEVELFPAQPTPAQLWAFASSRGPGLGARARSGADGRAMLENLGAGSVWAAVYAPGCPPLKSGPHEVRLDGERKVLEIALERGARIEGRVLTGAGAPVANAQLRLVERGDRLGFPLTLASDADGRYTSAWLPPGLYTIEAFEPEDPTRRSDAKELEVGAGEQRTLDLIL
jgi:hypothetical protein